MHQRTAHILASACPDLLVISSKSLVGGVSCVTTRAEVVYADDSSRYLIVKEIPSYCFELDPHFSQHHFELLARLTREGIKVPAGIAYGDATADFPTGYIVLDYIEGDTDFSGSNAQFLAESYADQLANIHAVKVDSLTNLQTQRFQPFVRRARPSSELEERVVKLLERIEIKLSGSLVLCHGDFWPGNVIWRNQRIVGVIDWENALIGDRLFDLANMRLDLCLIAGFEASTNATNRYLATTGAELAMLPYWDLRACQRLLRGIDSWSKVYPLVGRTDISPLRILQVIGAFAELAVQYLT